MKKSFDSVPRVLLLGAADRPPPVVGCTAMEQAARHNLVQRTKDARPEVLLLWLDDAGDLTLWLDAIGTLPEPVPAVVVVAGATLAEQRRGFELGVQVWRENDEGLDAALSWACWQFERARTLQIQLEERPWTERAKGVLMSACTVGEEAAHRLLRDAAMQARLRLPDLARSVVQTAQLAEGVNLAGQQRMLSQRIVKLIAQRAAAIEPRRAKQLQDESAARVDANLARLAALLPDQDLQAVSAAWSALTPLLQGKPTAEVLLAADGAAQTLLEHSDQLAAAIERAGAHKPLHLINLCGRQRMLSQRLAKQALLADLLLDLLPGDAPASMALCLDAFAAGLSELEAAPLSSPAIRELLSAAREEWLHLLRALRGSHGREAAAGLARSSELLLSQFDHLTARYQQSLQILLA